MLSYLNDVKKQMVSLLQGPLNKIRFPWQPTQASGSPRTRIMKTFHGCWMEPCAYTEHNYAEAITVEDRVDILSVFIVC